jgi:hypothetical protein
MFSNHRYLNDASSIGDCAINRADRFTTRPVVACGKNSSWPLEVRRAVFAYTGGSEKMIAFTSIEKIFCIHNLKEKNYEH